jgi:hypothetical protein
MVVEKLSDDARAILAFIKSYPGVEAKHIAMHLGLPAERLEAGISKLYSCKLIDATYAWTEPSKVPLARMAITRYFSRV